MPAIDRGLEAFLPDGLREALRRSLRELAGVGLIGLAILLALALATWSVQDPSLSHATNAPIRNVLGFPGAIVADLLMQLFGVAALAFVLPVAVWGWRLASHRPLSRSGSGCSSGSSACCSPPPLRPVCRAADLAVAGRTRRRDRRRAACACRPCSAARAHRAWSGWRLAAATGIGCAGLFAIASGFGWQGAEASATPTSRRAARGTRLGLARLDHARLPQPQGAARPPVRAAPARTAPRRDASAAHGRAEPRFDAERSRHAAARDRAGHRRDEEDEEAPRRAASRARLRARPAGRAADTCCPRWSCWRRRRRSDVPR